MDISIIKSDQNFKIRCNNSPDNLTLAYLHIPVNSHNSMLPHRLQCMDNLHILLNSHKHFAYFFVRINPASLSTYHFLCRWPYIHLEHECRFPPLFYWLTIKHDRKYRTMSKGHNYNKCDCSFVIYWNCSFKRNISCGSTLLPRITTPLFLCTVYIFRFFDLHRINCFHKITFLFYLLANYLTFLINASPQITNLGRQSFLMQLLIFQLPWHLVDTCPWTMQPLETGTQQNMC